VQGSNRDSHAHDDNGCAACEVVQRFTALTMFTASLIRGKYDKIGVHAVSRQGKEGQKRSFANNATSRALRQSG
jgi:hypothetical protein